MTKNEDFTPPSGGLETQYPHCTCELLCPHSQQEDEDNNTELGCCCESQMICGNENDLYIISVQIKSLLQKII